MTQSMPDLLVYVINMQMEMEMKKMMPLICFVMMDELMGGVRGLGSVFCSRSVGSVWLSGLWMQHFEFERPKKILQTHRSPIPTLIHEGWVGLNYYLKPPTHSQTELHARIAPIHPTSSHPRRKKEKLFFRNKHTFLNNFNYGSLTRPWEELPDASFFLLLLGSQQAASKSTWKVSILLILGICFVRL